MKHFLICALIIMLLPPHPAHGAEPSAAGLSMSDADRLLTMELGDRLDAPVDAIMAAHARLWLACQDNPSLQWRLGVRFHEAVAAPRLGDFSFERRLHLAQAMEDAIQRLPEANASEIPEAGYAALALWETVDARLFAEKAAGWLESVREAEGMALRRSDAERRRMGALWFAHGGGEWGRAVQLFGEYLAAPASDGDGSDREFRAGFAYRVAREWLGTDITPANIAEWLAPHTEQLLAVTSDFWGRLDFAENFAGLLQRGGKAEEALHVASRFEEERPALFGIRLDALRMLGRLEEARTLASERIVRRPGTPESYRALAAWSDAEAEAGDLPLAEGLACLAWDVALADAEVEDASRRLAERLAAWGDMDAALAAWAAHAGEGGAASAKRAAGLPFQEALLAQAEHYPAHGAFRERALRFLYAGRPDAALTLALRAEWRLESSPPGSPHGMEDDLRLTAACLRAHTGGMEVPRRYLAWRLNGPGPEAAGGAEGDRGPPAEILSPPDWPAAQLHAAHRRMAGWLREDGLAEPGFFDELLAYGTELSLAGDRESALGLARAAYAMARDRGQMARAALAVARALAARDGHWAEARAFLERQRSGQAAPGKGPVEADPLTGLDWHLPAPMASSLGELSQYFESRGMWAPLGHVRLLQGRPLEAARAYLRSRPAMLLREERVREHLGSLLASRKAMDGHPHNEGWVLEWFRYGPDGPDGLPDTDDDLADPFAE